jgi:hypothetical protein
MPKVTAPDGRQWKLGRRWMPGRRRVWRPKMRDTGDGSWVDFGGDDLGIVGAIVLAVIAVVVIAFLALILLNVVALAIELIIIVVLLLGGIVGRVVFRRPWTIYAKTAGHEWQQRVVGWRASGRAIDAAASRIASGAELEPAPGDRR